MAVVRMAEIPGKGRGWVAARPIKGGEVVLRDSPILLYDASPEDHVPNHCAHCFTTVRSGSSLKCPGCCHRVFCGPRCSGAASASSHSPWACGALRRLAPSLPEDRLLQARFLVVAYCLAQSSPEEFRLLTALQGSGDKSAVAAAGEVHSVLGGLGEWNVEALASLIEKDRLNAFGLMEAAGSGGARSVRAYGIYPNASLFNHDCLPNACRFDYLDSSGPDLVFRAIHDVAEGSEICLSYFPVNLDYKARQTRLRDDYGFNCVCDRCRVESKWVVDKEEEEDNADDDDAMHGDGYDDDDDDDDDDEAMDGGDNDNDDPDSEAFPHSYFFARYMCGRPDCGGTLAPLPPEQQQSRELLTMECNVCADLTSLQN